MDLSLSLILNNHLNKAKTGFKEGAGLNLTYKLALFDVFNGISINGLAISQDEKKVFDTTNIKLKVDLGNTLLNRRLLCREIIVNDPHIYKIEHFDKSYLSFLLAGTKDSGDILKSVMLRLFNLNYMGLINLDMGGYVALAQDKILLSRGKMQILKAAFLGKTVFDQSNSLLDNPLDYSFESTFIDGDFVVNKLDVVGFTARLVAFGRVKDYGSTAELDFNGELSDFMLEDVKQLNNDYVYARGILSSKFVVKGAAGQPGFRADIKIRDSNIRILDSLRVDNINSDFVWDNSGFRSEKISGLMDGEPVNLKLLFEKQDGKNIINLEFLATNLGLLDDLKIGFEGSLLKNVLSGDIEVGFSRAYNQKILKKRYNLENFNLDFLDFEFNCDSAQIQLSEKKQQQTEEKVRNILFSEINGALSMIKDSLELHSFQAKLFDGALKGKASISSQEKSLQYDARINLYDLDSNALVKDLFSADYELSGPLSGNITVNSKLRENVTGDVQIVNGQIKDNEILIAISDFFGIPSLKTVAFSNLKIIFFKVWNKYDSKISLFSPDVAIYLDNKTFEDDELDGYLLVKLATTLMDESPRFKRLFRNIGYAEPTVYFPFQLKGYFDRPRIEWLESEFKEKLEDFLPDTHKKLLQDSLNDLVRDSSQ